MKSPIFISNGNSKLIAHQGLSSMERGNTLPAFIAAANRPYYGIETDVHVTGDGKFICLHNDDTFDVSGDSINVEKSSFDTIRAVKLKDLDGSRGRCDLRIPTLEEYITICREYGKQAVLELKNRIPTDKIAEIVDVIREMKYLDGTTFISFNLENLTDIRSILPKQSAQLLIWDKTFPSELVDTLNKHQLDLDIYFELLTKENVKLLHENGITINAWTVDDLHKAEELISWGVDQVTSNILCPN